MARLMCKKRANTGKGTDRMVQDFKKNVFVAAGMSLLLGLGWGFGLSATSSDLKELTFAFQVVFSVFVGCQGVVIFIFHGLRSTHFRFVWGSCFGLNREPTMLNATKVSTNSQNNNWTFSQAVSGTDDKVEECTLEAVELTNAVEDEQVQNTQKV